MIHQDNQAGIVSKVQFETIVAAQLETWDGSVTREAGAKGIEKLLKGF